MGYDCVVSMVFYSLIYGIGKRVILMGKPIHVIMMQLVANMMSLIPIWGWTSCLQGPV